MAGLSAWGGKRRGYAELPRRTPLGHVHGATSNGARVKATQPAVDLQSSMSRRVYAGRKDVLAKGVPKPLFAFAGVAIGLTSFIVLRVVLNPWGVNPSGAETQRVKGAKTERERQAEIHALENAEREQHRR